ncbi:MAG TPA: hypothetical protein VEI25_15120 [Paraburkholderia sp.]|nr:hypothetical protein [Paraburkholderia sp.]
MKGIRQAVVAVALSVGLVSCAEAHVFVGVGISTPVVMPAVPAVPVVAAPIYVPRPVYYAPPPVYTTPVVVGYYGHPGWGYRHYYGYGYGYWRP